MPGALARAWTEGEGTLIRVWTLAPGARAGAPARPLAGPMAGRLPAPGSWRRGATLLRPASACPCRPARRRAPRRDAGGVIAVYHHHLLYEQATPLSLLRRSMA